MTTRAFRICAVPFLVMWFNMYTSCFFTALNDGAVIVNPRQVTYEAVIRILEYCYEERGDDHGRH